MSILAMLVATLSDRIIGNMLLGTGMKSKIPKHEATIPRLGVTWAGEKTTRAAHDF